MNAQTLWNNYINSDSNSDLLAVAPAIIEHFGGVDAYSLQQLGTLRDARDGYTGFIYTADGFNLWKAQRDNFLPYMENEAEECGYSNVFEMIQNFGAFRNSDKPTMKEMAVALYGDMDKLDDNYLPYILACCMLESLANDFQCWLSNLDDELDLDELTDAEAE